MRLTANGKGHRWILAALAIVALWMTRDADHGPPRSTSGHVLDGAAQ